MHMRLVGSILLQCGLLSLVPPIVYMSHDIMKSSSAAPAPCYIPACLPACLPAIIACPTCRTGAMPPRCPALRPAP